MYSIENTYNVKTPDNENNNNNNNGNDDFEEPSIYDLPADTIETKVVEEKSIYESDDVSESDLNKIVANENSNKEADVSIYEIHQNQNDVNKTLIDKLEIYENYTYSSEEKKLSFIGNDVEDLPTELIYLFGLKALILDISFNNLSELKDISQFPYLEELICDNNFISENSHFPNLPNLKLFSCNKNKIQDIHIFIDKVKNYFPKITYLSLLGNDACPNQLMNKDDYDYSKYRKYVIYRLPAIKFLDSYEVTALEREEATKDPLFYDVISYKEEDDLSESQSNNEFKNSKYTPLSSSSASDAKEVDPKASYGVCRYIYYGKQSEGNRFIKNDDL